MAITNPARARLYAYRFPLLNARQWLTALGGVVAAPTAPINQTVPTISGTPGSTLTGTPGTFDKGTVTSYWIADYIVVSSAATLDSSLYPGRSIRYESVATNGATSRSAVSAAVSAGVAGTTILSESFTRANGTLLSALGFTIEGQTTLAGGDLTNYQVQSNQATNTAGLSSAEPTAVVDTTSTSHTVSIGCVGTNAFGLTFAEVNNLNYLYIINNGPRGSCQEFQFKNVLSGVDGPAAGNNYFYTPVLTSNNIIKVVVANGAFSFFLDGIQYQPQAFSSTPTPITGSSATAFPAALATTGTKVGLRGGDFSNKLGINFLAVNNTLPFTVSSANDTAVLPSYSTGRTITVSGTYTGTVPTGIDLGLVDANGNILIPRTASVSPTISGGTWAATISSLAAISGTVYAQAWKAGTATATGQSFGFVSTVYGTIGASRTGLNADHAAVYAVSAASRDLFLQSQWRDTSFNYINGRDVVYAAGIPTSSDGSGSTVKMDYDGRIYATNGAGLSGYRLSLPWYTHPNRAGTYQIDFGAAVTATPSGLTGWTSNGSGKWTFTRSAGSNGGSQYVDVTTASIPGGGIKPVIAFVADANPSRISTDEAAANQIGSIIRWMDGRKINNDDMPSRTTSTLPSRGTTQRWTGPAQNGRMSRELIVNTNNLAARDLWWNVSHIDSDALISEDMAYIASNLTAGKAVYIEYSNEPWNSAFNQYNDLNLSGLRRGYGPSALTTAASAVPETIIDATGYVDPSTGVTSSSTAAGASVFVANVYGVGAVVYTAVGTNGAGVNPVPITGASNANWTLKYNNAQCSTAGQRFLMTRTKEVKALANTAFAAAGRANPTMVLNCQTGTFAGAVQPILDWDSGWSTMSGHRIAIAPYWGGGQAGFTTGTYTSTSVSGWLQAQKDLAFTNLASCLNAAFAAFPAVIDGSIDSAATLKHAMASYCIAKGLGKDAITLCAYEGQWHTVFSGWPGNETTTTSMTVATGSQTMTVATGKPYVAGNTVTITSNANSANTMTGAVTAYNSGTGALTVNVTSVTGAGTTASWAVYFDAPLTLFDALIRDSRMGTMMTRYLARWKDKVGSDLVLYQRVDNLPTNTTAPQSWSLSESDTDIDVSGGGSTNWRWKAISDFAAANP